MFLDSVEKATVRRANPKATSMATEGEWQLVTHRRRRYPPNWPTNLTHKYSGVKPYIPYPSTLSYAQVAAQPSRSPTPSQTSRATSPVTSRNTSPSHSPPNSPKATTYISPHSPTNLRFPPSSKFPEWVGRCFRCCRTGHTAAACRNPAKCGKCWKNGHVGAKYRVPGLNPAAKPFVPTGQLKKAAEEPPFDNMLTGTYPYVPPQMPPNRRKKAVCYVDRDPEYFEEMENLSRAIVVTNDNPDYDMPIDDLASFLTESKKVTKEELKISRLSGKRYLVSLPPNIAPETLIANIPPGLWQKGFRFSHYNPYEDATINIPGYRVLFDLIDLPPYLYREKEVIRIASGFGIYLGSVAQESQANIAVWTAVVVTDDLAWIPEELTMKAGGLDTPVKVVVKKIMHNPIYTKDDLPREPPQVIPPPMPETVEEETDSDENICIPYRVLVDLCKGKELQTLPLDVQEYFRKNPRPETIVPETPSQPEPPSETIPTTQMVTQATNTGNRPMFSARPQRVVNRYDTTQDPPHPLLHNPIPKKLIPHASHAPRASSNTCTQKPKQMAPNQNVLHLTSSGAISVSAKGKGSLETAGVSSTGQRDKTTVTGDVEQKTKGCNATGPTKAQFKPKRKIRTEGLVGTDLRSKPIAGARKHMKPTEEGNTNPVQMDLSADGFFQVRVDYDHCAALGALCGVHSSQVSKAIEEENEIMKNMPNKHIRFENEGEQSALQNADGAQDPEEGGEL